MKSTVTPVKNPAVTVTVEFTEDEAVRLRDLLGASYEDDDYYEKAWDGNGKSPNLRDLYDALCP